MVKKTLFVLFAMLVPVFARQPNVVVFLSDDQGWGDLGWTGNTVVKTPHIDGLSHSGARFDNFYVSPVCSPTRAEFLTGRHHSRSGVYSTSRGGERMNSDEVTIADLFRKAGYKTAAFGKWHSGQQFPYHPNARGFDEFYGFCSGHWGNYFSPLLDHNGRMVQGRGYLTDDLTDHAIAFIKDNRNSPFFVYVPFNTPHSPMQVPDRWWDEYKDAELQKHLKISSENIQHSRAALAMCANIDWNVGRLIQMLDELKLSEDTIVVYFSDNGPNGHRWNGGLRGKKGSTDEGGVQSPLVISWPGHIAADTRISHLSSAMDLLPTLADLAGVPIVGNRPLDGISLKPLLTGNQMEDREVLISSWKSSVSVRTPRFRLDQKGNLYDMQADPGQRNDVSALHAAVAEDLRRRAAEWKRDMLKDFGKDDRPFVVGHPDTTYTVIPARDGTAHGNIKRSSRHPNDSFFTNWTDEEDRISWACEVGQTGRYKVEVFYTCPEADTGSTVELSFNNSRLTGKVEPAHNPPLKGMEHDRVPRQESYVKDFQSLELGEIKLEAGKGELMLKALDIPGSLVMDFRLLQLTRLD